MRCFIIAKVFVARVLALCMMVLVLLTACSLTVAPIGDATPVPVADVTQMPSREATTAPPPAVASEKVTAVSQVATTTSSLAGRLMYVEHGDMFVWTNGTATQLTNDGRFASPAWAPDGTSIAVVRRDEESLSNVYLLDGNGQNARQVTRVERTAPARSRDAVHEVVWADGPAWSPDGRSLVYVSQTRPPSTEDANPPLYEYPLSIFEAPVRSQNGLPGASTLLVRTTGVDLQQPAWAPDESFLAYVDMPRDTGKQRQIRLYDPQTQQSRSYPNMPTNVYDPAWSPDGKWLAFTGVVDGQTDVWVIGKPTTDGAPIRLTTIGGARAAAWSPDGRSLAYMQIDDHGANLYALALETTNDGQFRAGAAQQLTTSGAVDANSRASWTQ